MSRTSYSGEAEEVLDLRGLGEADIVGAVRRGLAVGGGADGHGVAEVAQLDDGAAGRYLDVVWVGADRQNVRHEPLLYAVP